MKFKLLKKSGATKMNASSKAEISMATTKVEGGGEAAHGSVMEK